MLPGRHGGQRAWSAPTAFWRTTPAPSPGTSGTKDIYPDQVWLDGLYMGMPFYAACLAENGENHWDDILDQFTRRPQTAVG